MKRIDNDNKDSSQSARSTSAANIADDLPFCELHRHLESVRLGTILELAGQHGLSLPAATEATLAPYVHIDEAQPGLLPFLERFRYMIEVLADPEACERVAYENVEDAWREGLDHVELRFSPWFMAERHGLAPEAVVEACVAGVCRARLDYPISVGLIGILSRTYGPETCRRELDALLTCRDALVALDLAGDEAGFPAALFIEHFRRARDAGLHVTVHAGEAAGAESVWSALHDLGAERIGHGVRAVEDVALVEHLAAAQIGLECCPTSNLHTSTVASYAEHPIRQMAAAGVPFCLNTDDPGISAITIAHEYAVAAPAIGLDPATIRGAQEASLTMAFLSDQDKSQLRERAATRSRSSAP